MKRTVFQAALTPDWMYKMKKIAEYRGISMSALLRQWIAAAWARLPEEAK